MADVSDISLLLLFFFGIRYCGGKLVWLGIVQLLGTVSLLQKKYTSSVSNKSAWGCLVA